MRRIRVWVFAPESNGRGGPWVPAVAFGSAIESVVVGGMEEGETSRAYWYVMSFWKSFTMMACLVVKVSLLYLEMVE